MDELNLFPKNIDVSSQVLFLNFGEEEASYCLALLKQLRENNINSELYPTDDKIKKQMNYANKKAVQFVVMIGEDEIKSGELTIKDMRSGDQRQMKVSELINFLSSDENL